MNTIPSMEDKITNPTFQSFGTKISSCKDSLDKHQSNEEIFNIYNAFKSPSLEDVCTLSEDEEKVYIGEVFSKASLENLIKIYIDSVPILCSKEASKRYITITAPNFIYHNIHNIFKTYIEMFKLESIDLESLTSKFRIKSVYIMDLGWISLEKSIDNAFIIK